jgi:hypothetical protein
MELAGPGIGMVGGGGASVVRWEVSGAWPGTLLAVSAWRLSWWSTADCNGAGRGVSMASLSGQPRNDRSECLDLVAKDGDVGDPKAAAVG